MESKSLLKKCMPNEEEDLQKKFRQIQRKRDYLIK